MNKIRLVIIGVLACASAMAQVATVDDLLQVIARRVRHGTAVPGSCAPGQIFIDDDATSGQQFYACSGGSFVLQGDGNGSGAKGLNFVGAFASRPAANTLTDGLAYISDCIDDACSAGGGTIGRLQVDTGTSWITVSRSLLGLVIGTDVQPFDTDLSTYAGITPSANVQSLLGAANYAAMKTLLSLVVGTDVQAFDSDLSALAANSTNGIWARTGAGTGSARTLTGTGNEIAVTNGDGVSGNPTFSLALTFDISGKTSTKPVKTGTAAPGTCGLGELFYDTDATAGQNLYGCTALNTWTLLGDGTGGGSVTTGSGSPSTGAANTFYIDTSASPRRVWIFVDTNTPREIPTAAGSGATNALWTCGTLPSAPSAGSAYFSCNSSDGDRPGFVTSGATYKAFTDAEMAAKAATIASGTASLGTSSISANSCASAVTVSATGVATTDVISFNPNADISGVTGYGAGGTLTIRQYPTANNVNFLVCNADQTNPVTPGAVTLNWRVAR